MQGSSGLGPATAGNLQLAAHQPDTVSFNAVLKATDAPEKVMEAVGMGWFSAGCPSVVCTKNAWNCKGPKSWENVGISGHWPLSSSAEVV